MNTNAGGAFLNELLAKAQLACCREMNQPFRFSPVGAFGTMSSPCSRPNGASMETDRPLRRIAIVDDEPEAQYLYPEFILAREMLARAGYEAEIAAPESLRFEGGRLLLEGEPVDLVYNRLVDFALEEPRHAALRMAYVSHAAAITPNPHNHALMADKRNLVLLSDRQTSGGDRRGAAAAGRAAVGAEDGGGRGRQCG